MSEPLGQQSEASAPKRASLFGRRDKPPPEPPTRPAAPPPEPPRRRRRGGLSILSGLLTFVLIAAIIAMAGYVWAMYEVGRPGPLEADKVVPLVKVDDGGSFAEQLERAGVIESWVSFTLMTWIDGSHSKLKRAEYQFKQHASLSDVEHVLTSGKPVQHPLTIPEGLTSLQVVQRVRDADFLADDVKDKDIPREGSILPDTYDFSRGDSRAQALTRMEKAQARVVDEIWKKRAPDLPLKSPGELVTLASIVEKETGKADERPRVAGVFINRLQKRMKLQSDPTIVYGLVFGKGTLGHSISKAELDQVTPYNTYIIEGLPPGPISNPGKAALQAVANPMRTKELFFVADGSGGHAFAETLDQHQKNVLHWRQIEKDAKDKVAPDATPAIPGATPAPAATHGALEPIDPRVFGALGPAAAPVAGNSALEARLVRLAAQTHRAADTAHFAAFGGLGPAPTTGASATVLGVQLAKLGSQRQAVEALLGPNGTLTGSCRSARTLEDIGAVVQGVNDVSSDGELALGDDPGPSGAPVASYPMSPTSLADLQARAARYGRAPVAEQLAPANPAPAGAVAAIEQKVVRAHAFDASEGTALDPLLNKTYDLSYAKAVPKLQ